MPVTGISTTNAETPTQELSLEDTSMIESWVQSHFARSSDKSSGIIRGGPAPKSTAEMSLKPTPGRTEVGFRVCPKCGKPLHLSAEVCRACGTSVPKQR